MTGIVELHSDQLSVRLDPGRGADVVDIAHRETGADILFSTPWRRRAEAVLDGVRAPSTTDSVAGWLEQYRGGWQTLCPNAGPPRRMGGAPLGFHGEASIVPWEVVESSETTVTLRTELFTVPILIERFVTLDGPTLVSVDTLSNLSSVGLDIDYASHPALGGTFLQGDCTIDTGARRFTSDPDSVSTIAEPGSMHEWPWVTAADGTRHDMRQLPGAEDSRVVFGWLSDFSAPWAAVSNPALGLTVRIEWSGEYLPYAWLWEELNGSEGFPWFRRVRVIAIEPSSTQTGGADRRTAVHLGPGQVIRIPLSVTVERSGEAQS